MKSLLALFILLIISFNLAAQELIPFTWNYDVTYIKGKITYKGTGSYVLAAIGKDIESANNSKKKNKRKKKPKYPADAAYTFTASIETNSKAFSSADTLWLRYDSTNYVVPLQRKQKMLILGFPRRRNIPLTPLDEGAYYGEQSAVLFLRNEVKKYVTGQSPNKEWEIWLADRGKIEKYYLAADEKISTPLGEIDCYVVAKEEKNNRRQFHVWLAKDGLYIAKVVQTNGKEKTSMIITSYQ